jgi:hypothetical protein
VEGNTITVTFAPEPSDCCRIAQSLLWVLLPGPAGLEDSRVNPDGLVCTAEAIVALAPAVMDVLVAVVVVAADGLLVTTNATTAAMIRRASTMIVTVKVVERFFAGS